MKLTAVLTVFLSVIVGCTEKSDNATSAPTTPQKASAVVIPASGIKNQAKDEKEVWGACSPENRARIVEIRDPGPGLEQLTFRYEISGKDEVTQPYQKGVNEFVPKIGEPFCNEDDVD